MIKFNILCFFMIIFFTFYSYLSFEKEKEKENKVIVQKINEKSLNIKREDKNSYRFRIFNEEVKEKYKQGETEKGKSREEKLDKVNKSSPRIFKDIDEMMDTLFPTFEEEFGIEEKERYQSKIPYILMQELLTEEQKKEFKKIKELRKQGIRAVSSGHPIKIGEFEQIINETTIVQEYYTLEFLNLLTKEQQYEFAKIVDNEFFNILRKTLGFPLKK